MARFARGLRLATPLMLILTLILSGLAVDAKKNKHKKPHHKPDRTVEVQSGSVPWANEQTVHVRFYASNVWLPAAEHVVAEMNRLTASMPNAPRWVLVNHPRTSCQAIDDGQISGITICGATENTGGDYQKIFMPPGVGGESYECGIASGTGGYPRRAANGAEDGWYANITLEDANVAADPPCSTSFYGTHGWLFHEMSHAAFTCPGTHPDNWSCGGARPWGPGDFNQAEAWFGESTVPFCELYPSSSYC